MGIDASIKPLYGRQEGAEIGYNPSKPMRPSHVLHTFLEANLRLVLDVQVSSGKQHTSGHAKAALGTLLDELGPQRPALVRGASGCGNEGRLGEALGQRATCGWPALSDRGNRTTSDGHVRRGTGRAGSEDRE